MKNRKFVKAMMLVATMLVTGICHVQASVNLGYCAGEVNTQGALTVDGNRWVSGAIYLPASMLQNYDGMQIETVRAGLASRINLDSLRVWVRTDLQEANLGEGVITNKTTPKIKSGWNEVALQSPVTIVASDGLYVGFSYHQKAEASAFSAVGSAFDNAFFAQMSADDDWQDLSSIGILSVEAVVAGASLPEYDLGIISANARPSEFSQSYQLSAKVANMGQHDVSGFTLSTYYTGFEAQPELTHFDQSIPAGGSLEVQYLVSQCPDVDNKEVHVCIAGIDDGNDGVEGNNSMMARFSYKRKVLIEEFTTEKCGNCPRVAGYLHAALDNYGYADDVVVVCHHAGYYTDSFTQDCDVEMNNIYSINYAPAMMFDRAPLFGSQPDISPNLNDITSSVDTRLAIDPNVSLSFDVSLNSLDNTLNVTVHGVRSTVFTNLPTHLTVYLTEDNLPAVYQSGADDPTAFIHNHVIRAYNSTWGDEICWNVNQFDMEYHFELDPAWKTQDMKVVAAVSAYNAEDMKQSVIENAEEFKLESASAITNVFDDPRGSQSLSSSAPCYYDLMGRSYSRPKAGMLLIKR